MFSNSPVQTKASCSSSCCGEQQQQGMEAFTHTSNSEVGKSAGCHTKDTDVPHLPCLGRFGNIPHAAAPPDTAQTHQKSMHTRWISVMTYFLGINEWLLWRSASIIPTT